MKASELRIGNYVEDTFNLGKRETTQISLEDFAVMLNYGNQSITYRPIKITDEWLDKFGFDDVEYKNGYIGFEFRTNMIMDFVLTKPKFMGEWQDDYCFDLGQHRFVPVKYVHQLQNLFFAITMTELEIKQDVSG